MDAARRAGRSTTLRSIARGCALGGSQRVRLYLLSLLGLALLTGVLVVALRPAGV